MLIRQRVSTHNVLECLIIFKISYFSFLDTDPIHSPNVHFGIWNFLNGIETIPHFISILWC